MANLTASLDFQAHALTLRSERQRLIASNIANADTPGYVARDLDFKSALKGAADAMNGSSASGLTATNRGHISTSGGAGGGGGSASLNYVVNSQNSIDQNTVDMDRERAAFADNTIKFEATLRFISGDAKNLMDAIKGGQ
jgi:flagellar basal-body rod protein FlgB